MADENKSQVAVVVVPLPAQGHLNQLLHLCRLISAYKIPIYYFTTATHNRQAKTRVQGFDPLALANLHFHDFPLPSAPFQNISASASHGASMLLTLLTLLQKPLHEFLNKLSTKFTRLVLIFDSLLSTSVSETVKSVPNVESYCFETGSALASFSFYWEVTGKPVFPLDLADIMKELPSFEECFGPGTLRVVLSQILARNFQSGVIYNSNRALEGLHLDLLSKTRISGPGKHFAFGPFTPISLPEIKQGLETCRPECLHWLDKQEKNSVIFVSFGTTSVLSDEQVEEIAIGLENSHQKFVWVLRDADKGNIFEGEVRNPKLPKGFKERVRERGIIVRDWAPQLEILGHSATGGFLTHCGWNSCMESISMGVPIATWPMQYDQPINAVLLTKVLKIGLKVRDWKQRNELISSVKVAEDVKRLMGSSEGDEMRQRVEKLAEVVKESMMEGGSTRLEMDSFIAHISRLVSSSEL